jgi:prepilin signal peptidase PulO-like enzyme (type II secretory pathway)
LRESWQIFVAQIRSWHAPLGRYSPFAASALFAASAFSHSMTLRLLAYGVATILALFIAVDLAHSLLELESPSVERERSRRLRYIPVNWFQFALAAALAAIYTWFIFVGLGPWTPFVFAVLLYPLCYLVAWRNVRLWYQQGADYEEVLKEEAELERVRASHARMRNSDRDRARVLP